MKKNVLIIASSARHIGPNNRPTGSFLTEIAHPYETFKKQGYQVDIFSIQGGEAPLDGMHEKDEAVNIAFLEGDGLVKMKNTLSVDQIAANQYDAVFVPGGLAPMVDMPNNKTAQSIIANIYESGGVVGAVCHGPVALLNVQLSDGSYLIDGKNLTSFSNAEEENYAQADVPFLLESALKEKGAHYTAAAVWQNYSVVDGRLVTGQNPASATAVAEKMIAVLEQPIHVFAKWQVKEGQTTAVLNLLQEVVAKSEAEKGNLFYKVHQSNTDSNTIVLFEGYTDEAALKAHREADHFQQVVVEQIVPLLENREVIVTRPVAQGL